MQQNSYLKSGLKLYFELIFNFDNGKAENSLRKDNSPAKILFYLNVTCARKLLSHILTILSCK